MLKEKRDSYKKNRDRMAEKGRQEMQLPLASPSSVAKQLRDQIASFRKILTRLLMIIVNNAI